MSAFRVPAGFLVAALAFYFSTPSPNLILAGAPIGLLGLIFRAAAAGVIHKDEVLARNGPYRLSRNPLYWGSFMLTIGFAVMSGNLAVGILLIISFVCVYPVVMRQEEKHLQELFGEEFRKFKEVVPFFFPRRLDLTMFEDFSLRQYLSNREYNSLAGFVGATAVLLLKSFLNAG